ncbi:asparagine synthase (glutamine-hydrolyzing) [bacterium]|nr:asparagine synthase (glutamine-hydrolyzing) [bacterium]
MCGICGILKKEAYQTVSPSLLSSMCQTLYHRGPDDQGLFTQKNVGLGTRRLSIIDVEKGHQPLSNENQSIWVTHNGEIYNFPSLSDKLIQRGHHFSTRTDTETLVHSYEEWGEEFVHKLRGMFSFALWDGNKDKLILVRDRMGIKPLYYSILQDKTLVFGSELKALLAHPGIHRAVEPQALNLFLTLEYIPSPFSIFQNIFKLPPGCMLIYKKGHVRIQKYWDVKAPSEESPNLAGKTLPELKEILFSLLQESVKLRLLSDVPLGSFLSGGIDSSAIVGLMRKLGASPLKTFSIGFKEASYNELKHARRIVKKFDTEHHEFIVQPQALDLTEKLVRHLDEPLGDFSIFPTYLVSRMARDHVKVILSGDGGDEIFGGYEHYQAQKLSRLVPPSLFSFFMPSLIKKFPPAPEKKGVWNKLRRYFQGFEHNPQLRHLRWMMFLSLKEKGKLYSPHFIHSLGGNREILELPPFSQIFPQLTQSDPVTGELFLDLKSYLVDNILVKVDRMSMAASLETRVPLLDHKIVEFMFHLPGKLKIHHLTTKWLFKKTMDPWLPRENIYRAKEGFSIPIKHWLRTELKDLMLDYLNEKRIQKEGLFHFPQIKRMIDAHLQGRENFSHQLWSLLVFEIWKENYLER